MTPITTDSLPRLYTIQEAADSLRVHRRTLLHWIRDGRVSAVRLTPGSVRITAAELERLIAGESTNETSPVA
jgi:excisionase family DNA binding protein